MPETLQYSETGEMLQERIDNVESVISELEGISELESLIDDYADEHEDFDADEVKEDYDKLPEEVKDQFISEIDDALSGLEY